MHGHTKTALVGFPTAETCADAIDAADPFAADFAAHAKAVAKISRPVAAAHDQGAGQQED